MGELAARTIFSNDTGPLAGTGLDTLAKNQGAILELEGAQAPQSKTITDGSISPTAAYVIVDTEGSAAADDLDVISPVLSASENLHDGMVVYLKAADSGRVVTVKNSGSANGINTYDGNAYVLSTTHWIKLQLRSGKWYEVEGRAMETALAAATAAASASTPATTTARGIGRVATAEDTAVGSTITNGPAFLDAATWKVSATPAAGVIPLADANGKLASWVDPVAAITGSFKNLKANASGTSVNISITVDELVVKNSSNVYLTLRSLSLTWNAAGSGVANGIDTGSITANTWYYVHVIHNPTTNTTALLMSLSATAPTLPSGYTYFARVGAIFTDATNKYPLAFNQHGRLVDYKPATGANITRYPVVASGSMGTMDNTTFTPATVSLASFAPPTACAASFIASTHGSTLFLGVSAHADGHTGGAGANPPPIQNNLSSGYMFSVSGRIHLESSNVYFASSAANGLLQIMGWEDNL